MNNKIGTTEWFMGRPYSSGDQFQINRRATTTGAHHDGTAHAGTISGHGTTATLMNLGNTGNATFAGKIASAHTVYCNVSISNSYVRVCKVDANTSQISTAVRVTGTSHGSSHVANFTADILANHYQDVLIRSLSGAYTQVSLKVESNNNGDYTLSVKAGTNSAATYYFKIEAISDNVTITPTPTSTPSSTTTHEHTTVFGSNETGVGGTLAHKFSGAMDIGSTTLPAASNAYVLDVKKAYSSGNGHVAYFGAGQFTAAKNSFDTVVVAQDDVPCLAIVEGNTAANTHGNEQALRLAVGDNNAVISSTVSGGLRFMTNRSTNVAGYLINDGISALHLANNGTATFAGSISTSGIVSTLANSVLISYSGNDANGNDAGLKIMNDGNDWGAYIRKTSNGNYGLRIDSGGNHALSIYSTTGGSTKTFGVAGDTGKVTHGGVELTTGTSVDQITEFTMTFQLTANTWTDTGIDGTDLSTGTYAMQVYVSDYGLGGEHYDEYYSATISWWSSSTNSTAVDEIVMHRAGHAPNAGDVQFRTLRALGTDSHDLMLQVKHNKSYSAAVNNTSGKQFRFKFRRLM